MKTLGLIAGIGLVLGGLLPQAQLYGAGTTGTASGGIVVGPVMPLIDQNYSSDGNYGYLSYGDKAVTAAQSVDYGIARVLRGEGEYLLLGSQAAINLTEAQRRGIENWKTWVHTLFEVQRYNREARAIDRGPPLTQATILRMAQVGKPHRLTPSEMDTITGQLTWPLVLQSAEFSPYRRFVDQIFADRAYRGVLNLNEYMQAQSTIRFMLSLLREQIQEFQPIDYMAGRRFLESLAFEARPAPVPTAPAPAPVANAMTTLR